mmetsp:Transcript_31898/g.83431  ORF Transcript_31898/g.83431 Transcript_31898/m.83431 type:complete len:132 (-) Transcript_31898:424-819(-)
MSRESRRNPVHIPQSFYGAIRAASPDSFANCSAVINTTDPCWIRGFYEAVLGPDAGTPCTNRSIPIPPYNLYNCTFTIGGLPYKDVKSYWEAPFDSDDPTKGGCPALPVPPDATDRIASQLASTQLRLSSR